jgi:hypothetical protein
MHMLRTIRTFLMTALAVGALASTATLAYQASAPAADSTEMAISPGVRDVDAARLETTRTIAAVYGITVADRTAQWQLDEVLSLKSGLDRIADRMSQLTGRKGRRVMRQLFNGTTFYRDRYWRGNIAYTIGGTVSFYDVWTTCDNTGRAFYLAHELGHVLDAEDSPLHLLLGEVSQTFARDVAAYTDELGGYHLGRTYPLHDPRDQPRHRSDNAAEDWAESFATVVVPAFESDLRDIGEVREQEVQHLIGLWVEQYEAQQPHWQPRVTRK